MSLKHKLTPTILVAIVGGSGSGKTWLAEKLESALTPDAARLSLDDFYRDRSHQPSARRAQINFDQPRAIDWTGVETVIRTLAAGKAAQVPIYDFKTHSRRKDFEIVAPKPIVLIDGLWLLRRRSLRPLFRMKIFIDRRIRIRLKRRLERDLGARGRTAESVREQFWGMVEPMHRRYVAPQARYADVVIRGTCSAQQVARLAQKIRARIGLNDRRPSP